MKRNPTAVYSIEEVKQQLRNRNISHNPKKNPYSSFEFSDPVQKNLAELARQKRKPLALKSSAKHSIRGNQQLQASGHGNYAGFEGYIECKAATPSQTYMKLKDSDKKFGKAVIQAKNKKARMTNREVALEGRRLVLDALAAGATLKELYFSGKDTLNDEILEAMAGKPVYKVTYNEMKIWSDTDTPQGIVGIFEMPPEDMLPVKDCLPITLVFDQIRDPGNFGTLLRTAAAVGCEKVLAVKGCVDAWSPKVLRSGAGCHYRTPIVTDISWADIDRHIPEKAHIFVADSRKPSDEVLEELAGTSEIVDELDKLEAEEMYVDDLVSDQSESDSESDSDSEREVDYSVAIDMDERDSARSLSLFKQAPLNTNNYDEVDYVNKHTVIVIGGETQGISVHARKLAYSNYGQCVTIPMMADVESLNCSVAGSIVLYEASKQFRDVKKRDLLGNPKKVFDVRNAK